MKTKRYIDDSRKIDFNAHVIDCIKEENQYWIGLDETCFYYESGGMSSDVGLLNNLEVSKVKEKEGIIYHLVEQALEGEVHGIINQEARKEKIQVHTAQHLISYLVEEYYHGKTTSHHVGEESADIEFSLSEFSETQLMEIETKANQIIEEDITVTITYPTIEEIKAKGKEIKETHDEVRVVSIGAYDYNLCGCMHVGKTSEIKAIQLLGFTNTKRGLVIEYIAGNQLLRYWKNRIPVLQDASLALALPQKEIVSGIEKLKSQLKQMEYEYTKTKQQYCDLLVDWEFTHFDDTILVRTYENLEVKELQYLAARFVKEKEIAVILQLKKENQAHIIISKNTKVNELNAKELFEALKIEHGYKGGGSELVAQGGGEVIDELQEWVLAHI